MDNKERLREIVESWNSTHNFPLTTAELWNLLDAIIAANLLAPEWISVKERLPEIGQTVLVWNMRKGEVLFDSWNEQHESPVSFSTVTVPIGPGWDEEYDFHNITHWQPLPTPPKDQS